MNDGETSAIGASDGTGITGVNVCGAGVVVGTCATVGVAVGASDVDTTGAQVSVAVGGGSVIRPSDSRMLASSVLSSAWKRDRVST